MSAEVLREAAALMRARAEAATPSPWQIRHGQYVTTNSIPPALIGCDERPDAEHIASWHPAVALAVADWLDAEAASLEAMAVFTAVAATETYETDIRGAALTVTKAEDGTVSLRADTSRPALAVARAYMGERS